MTRHNIFVEYILWGHRNLELKVLEAVVDITACDVKKALQSSICPFCGKVFKNRKTLKTHLRRSGLCGEQYMLTVKHVVDVYTSLKRYILRFSSPKRNGICIDLPNRARVKFRNMQELAEWIRMHGDEILRLVVV